MPRPLSTVSRFLRYVTINTQSAEGQPSVPSTPGQWNLARLLVEELEALGVADVHLSDACMVYAHLPGTLPAGTVVPTVGFIAHVDTSPAVSGEGVTPVVFENYQGGDLVLPGDTSQVLRPADHPALTTLIGDDVITTDGTTLLGSDDKAGVAAIMGMVEALVADPEMPRGPVAVAFTADEEVGIGIDQFDIARFGADFAYTVDGEMLGEINHETWSARGATVTFEGVSAHPGSAKGVMVNAAYALADYILALPTDMRPETTDGRDGFIHPYNGLVDATTSVLTMILRDFEIAGLERQESIIRRVADEVAKRHRGVKVTVEFSDQYRNMNDVLKDHPMLVELALEASRRAGLEPRTAPIRGGTDGSKLTFRGLPCPNIFTGGLNFHSTLEFNSRRGLEKTTETLVQLVRLIGERPDAVRPSTSSS